MTLFNENITNWKDWSLVFQSIPAFECLIHEILKRENLKIEKIENLTPGTNAVFRVGSNVIKIYAPNESGLDSIIDFTNEQKVCEYLTKNKIPSTKLIASGSLQDKYLFYYIITEYVEGVEASEYLKNATYEQKKDFSIQLNNIIEKVHQNVGDLIPKIDIIDRYVNGDRIKRLPQSLQNDILERIKSIDLDQEKEVLVHGDLNASNIIVDKDGNIAIIDWADACIAPLWYEYGPIIFDLFKCDRELCNLFVDKEKSKDIIINEIINCLCIHDFGPDLIIESCKRRNVPIFNNIQEIYDFLNALFT